MEKAAQFYICADQEDKNDAEKYDRGSFIACVTFLLDVRREL